MPYLAHSAHLQMVGLWVGCVGCILNAVALGLVQWRVWHVADTTVITSGVAWVGIWRVCFYSGVLPVSENQIMFCQAIGLVDSFIPPEIPLAQALMIVALAMGLSGNASGVYGLRCVYFGLEARRAIRIAFSLAGVLCLLAGGCSLLPLAWNLNSVVANRTISFPAAFHMPPAPAAQDVGAGISVGIIASLLLIGSGVIFLLYRFPFAASPRVTPTSIGMSGSLRSTSEGPCQFRDNPAFQSQESLRDPTSNPDLNNQ